MLLSLEGVEWMVAQAIVQEAEELHFERKREEFKAMAVAVQNGVARAFKAK